MILNHEWSIQIQMIGYDRFTHQSCGRGTIMLRSAGDNNVPERPFL